MSLLRRASERRILSQFGDSSIPTNGSLAGPTAAGVPVNDRTAMQLVAVYACVRILSTALAGLPLNAMQYRDGIQVPVTPPLIVSDPFGGANNVRFPSRRAGLKQLAISLLLRGNGYGITTARDNLYRPTRIVVLHPDKVRVKINDDGGRDYEIDRKPVEDPADMLHLTGLCMPGAAEGMSPISYARQAIALGLAAERFGATFFEKGAHLSGVIEVPADMDKPRARQMKEGFEASHTGLSNAHALGVLSGGATWKPISISPEDAQFLGTRAAQNLDVAMLYGVPPHMLGQVDRTTSWGTGIAQQSLGFLTYTLADWIGVFEDAWSAMLPRPQVAKFDPDELLRTDTAGRWSFYTQARNIAGLTIDEIRAKENMPPLPDGAGKDPFAPLNSAHTTTPDAAPQPAPEPPAPDKEP